MNLEDMIVRVGDPHRGQDQVCLKIDLEATMIQSRRL